VFLRDGHAHLERFMPLGVPRTIVADLQALVNRFDEADRTWRTGQAGRTTAQDGINEAIKAGLDAMRTLDVIVPNTADDDPVLDASWRRARRTGRKVRTSPLKPVDPPAVAPVAPPAERRAGDDRDRRWPAAGTSKPADRWGTASSPR
jgi:hypothetical protein